MKGLSNKNVPYIKYITTLLNGLLQNPGDKFSARITDTGRQVLKISNSDGKISATRYPNGTVVETRTFRP